jgi:hypothetical protein
VCCEPEIESLSSQLEREPGHDPYPSTTIRLSRKFKGQVQNLAKAHGMSMNAFIVCALDAYCVQKSSHSLADLDPDFVAYLQRSNGRSD